MTLNLIVFIVLALFIGVCSVLAVTTSRILRAATYLLFVLFKAEPLKSKKMIAGLVSTLAGLGICLFVMLKHEFLPSKFVEGELDVQTIGHTLMGMGKYQYVLPFEVISILLLACIVGGIMIARKR